MADPNKDKNPAPENEPKPGDGDTPPEEGKGGNQGPTDEELRKLYQSGDLLTKERVNDIVTERLDREREAGKAKAEKERADAEEAARKKALKDQEDFKTLSESQATELESKNARITELEADKERVSTLEGLLTGIIDEQVSSLDKAYQELVNDMPVERRAQWLKDHPELLKTGEGPAGSPATPDPAERRRNGKRNSKEEEERAREARGGMRRTSRI